MIFILMSFSLSRSTCHSTLDTRPVSFDHLVRPVQHGLRNRHTDLLRGFKIEHQLKLRRLLDRQVGRLGSLQDSVHVVGYAPLAVREVRPVGHEPAGIYICTVAPHRREPAL